MSIQMNIQEAKARLSYLVAQAEKGQEVVLARAGRPVVRLQPVAPQAARKLGVFHTKLTEEAVAESVAPLSPDELALWESRRL